MAKVKRAIKPVTPVQKKCRNCTIFHPNGGDPYCEHKGYFFEAFFEGKKLERKTVEGWHQISYCKKHDVKYEQTGLFK